MPKTWDKFGLKWALENYDQQFSLVDNTYLASSIIALRLEPIRNGQIVADIGSGTGISTVAMCDSNPNLGRIVCIEPAKAINVAMHKFGHKSLFKIDDPEAIRNMLGVELYKEYITALKETKQRMQKFRDRILFINSPAQELSDLVQKGVIAPESVDKIYCMSSFHWLANNESNGRTSPGFVAESLKGFYEILKSGGVLVFNESGLQFDHNAEVVNDNGGQFKGRYVNDVHFLQHEFHRRFLGQLNDVLRENGFSESAQLDVSGKVDTYHFLFDMYNLTRILEDNGFRIRKLENRKAYLSNETGVESINYVPKHKNYLLTIMPKKALEWERLIVVAGNMRYFNHTDDLRRLTPEKREDILNEAYKRGVEKYGYLANIPFGETFATFVAVKR